MTSLTNPSILNLASQYRYEYIAIKSHAAISVVAFGIQTLTIPHNLGYVPYIKSFYTYDGIKYFDLFTGPYSYGIGGNGGQIDNAHIDTTNFIVEISENNGSLITGTLYYRIYAEPQT